MLSLDLITPGFNSLGNDNSIVWTASVWLKGLDVRLKEPFDGGLCTIMIFGWRIGLLISIPMRIEIVMRLLRRLSLLRWGILLEVLLFVLLVGIVSCRRSQECHTRHQK